MLEVKKNESGVVNIICTSRNPSNPKDCRCHDCLGPDQFPAPKSPSENNNYLFNSRF